MPDFVNQLILGDNLEVLKTIPKESVDLIYLDPPFFSNRNYEVIWGDEGEIRSFKDRWSGGIDHYIAWLKERVSEMYRVLKPTGSMFLHCDWHANAYIRVEILDRIFGYDKFISEIIWKRTNAHNFQSKKFDIVHDVILFYSKGAKYTWNPLFGQYSEAQLSRFKEDENGRLYKAENLTMTAASKTRNFNWRGSQPPAHRGWGASLEQLEKWWAEGKILTKLDGTPRLDGLKMFLDELPGKRLDSVWDDIDRVGNTSSERLGYPTQKPVSLLERIIKSSSNEGDCILDPFCGGGTTCSVADKLNRRWIGIDSSVSAIKVSEFRLNNQQDLFSKSFVVTLHKYDYDTLRYSNAFKFESWIIEQYGGEPNIKQRGDFGLDGVSKEKTPIQVKRSDNIGRNVIDNFNSAIQRYDKALYEKNKAANQPVGYIIAFSFGKGAIQEVARLHNHDDVIINLVEVADIVPISMKPKLTVQVNDLGSDKKGVKEIEFKASGESDHGIEFYAWDFAYKAETGFKPEVLIDKEGIQVFKFKPGIHQIAVKVIDNEGLENIEVIRLKVNGVLEKL